MRDLALTAAVMGGMFGGIDTQMRNIFQPLKVFFLQTGNISSIQAGR